MLCYGAGDGTGEIGTGGVEGEEKSCSQSARFPGPLARLAGSSCWDKAPSAGERLGRERLWDPQETGTGGQAGWGCQSVRVGGGRQEDRRAGGQGQGRLLQGFCGRA